MENRARLQKELSKLPPAYRAIMEFWIEGKKPAEIAQLLDIDVGIAYRCIESTKRKQAFFHYENCSRKFFH